MLNKSVGVPGGSVVKILSANAGGARSGFDTWIGKIPGGEVANHSSIPCLENSMWTEKFGELQSA